MWANAFTMEMEMHNEMQELLAQESVRMRNKGKDRFLCVDGEIRRENIQNCNKKTKD